MYLVKLLRRLGQGINSNGRKRSGIIKVEMNQQTTGKVLHFCTNPHLFWFPDEQRQTDSGAGLMKGTVATDSNVLMAT